MEGELRKLRDDYDPDYDIRKINDCSFAQLSTIKKQAESELFKLVDYLENDLQSDMTSPLIDGDGFPLEIDIVGVRLTRIKIIKYKNDLKTIMETLEKKMISEFQSKPKANSIQSQIPFVKIDEVIASSPAHHAGLKIGDKIVEAKKNIAINVTNHDNLQNLIKLIRSNIDKPILLTILRDGQLQKIEIVPSLNWPGSSGVLGCKLTQL